MAYTVTITGSGDSSLCYVTVNGQNYTSAATLAVDNGTEIVCYASSAIAGGEITVNGESVATGSPARYTLTVTANVEIALTNGGFSKSTIAITYEIVTDPMAPHDGHNTNINSTACQLESGTVLLNGVACEIELGMTLVGGVAYEIPFGPSVCTIKITGTGSTNAFAATYVKIDGTSYAADATLEVPSGTVIECKAGASAYTGGVYVNGVKMIDCGSTYNYTVTKSINISLSHTSSRPQSAYVRITEE